MASKRILEGEDYVAPVSKLTPAEVQAAVEAEAERARAKAVANALPPGLAATVAKVGAAANPAGPAIGANAAADEAAITAAAVAKAKPAGDPYAGMTRQQVDLEKARERGTFYGTANAGVSTTDKKSTPSFALPVTSTPYVATTTTTSTSTSTSTSGISADTRDAFALLQSTFEMYGLGSLANKIQQYMKDGLGPNEAALRLRTEPEYLARFDGNVRRQKAGLNVLSEAEYINLENQYSTLLTAYGAKKLANRTQFADLIANDVSPTEVNKRLDLAVTQVQNADPNIRAMLSQYYPQLKDSDLVSYMLAPDKALPALQEMVTTGQIGAAAYQQGLGVDVGRATQLAKLGVDQQAARTGYEKVATVLPTGQKLGQIYGEAAIPYSQTTAEQEFLEGNASAARKRRQLQALEEASFSGRSGIDTQVSPLGRSIQGKF